MEARNELDLQKQLHDSQPNKRLNEYRAGLTREGADVNFDDKILEVMYRYARYPGKIDSVRTYLNNLRDDTGVPFSRSHYEYSKMLETLQRFEAPDVSDGRWRKAFRFAFDRVKSRYEAASIKFRDYSCNEDIYEVIKDLDTSTGFAYFESGIRHKCDLPFDRLYREYRETVERALIDHSFNEYYIWFHRCQASGEFTDGGEMTYAFKQKSRPVWANSVKVYIAEALFQKPINNWLKNYSYSAIGKDDASINRFVNHYRAVFDRWISFDYSKYDSSIPAWLIHAAFDVLESAFVLDDFGRALLGVIRNDFIRKNVILDNCVKHVTHGNPSGSGLTAIINGVCNELITETWMAKFDVKRAKYMIMGDDNLIFIDKDVDIATIASYVMYNFGVEINSDKTKCGLRSDGPEFLSRMWRYDGPWRHPNILMSKMLFPERFRAYNKIPELTPELVFYSYVLGYRAAMNEIFDVGRFLEENGFLNLRIRTCDRTLVRNLPYNVQIARLVA
jgi:hypothetical protein